jgi:hypothetical protein
MAYFSWLAAADRLQPAALTVQAQALPPDDLGRLLWDEFYNRDPVPSVDLSGLTALDYRPTADRREWNAPGRRVPILTPGTQQISMVPIEANFVIDEKEMQRLFERAVGNEQIVRDQVSADVPKRTDLITMACWRRLEYDAMRAWATGQIIQRNPENAAETFALSFGFSSTRYTTAGTAWNDASVNAYDLFLAWYEGAERLAGPGAGAMVRLATFKAILADAPALQGGVKMTRSALTSRIQDDTGKAFDFFINESSVDVFDDGGLAFTRTNVWPAQKVAFVPQGQKIGRVAFAPVLRAWEIARDAGPGAGIDVNGVTVFHETRNAGKELEVQAQLNAFPVPSEQLCVVIDAGV